MPEPISDEQIRQWVLSDEYLYLWAREAGGGGDDEMYAHLPEFIRTNRSRLTGYISHQLALQDKLR